MSLAIHRHKSKDQYDRAGILISAICLVHCTVLPLGLAALQFWGINLFPEEHSHTFHLVMAVILLGVGGFAFAQGFLRHHRTLPLALGILGTTMLFVGALNPGHYLTHAQEHIVTISGTLVLIVAHLRNRLACATC